MTATAVQTFGLPVKTWKSNEHLVPAAAIQSALFSVALRNSDLTKQKLASLEHLAITYTGPQLDQLDLTTWASCVQLAIDCKCYTFNVSVADLLLETGLSKPSALAESLSFLRGGRVLINTKRHMFDGSLIKELLLDKDPKTYTIELSPTIVELFRDSTVVLDRNIRKAFGRDYLAMWLYTFYSSWTSGKVFPYSVATLHRLCGSARSDIPGFRRDLRKALKSVQDQTGWKCWHEPKKDLVYVQRPAANQTLAAPAPIAVATPATPIILTPGVDYHLDPALLARRADYHVAETELIREFTAGVPATDYPMLHRTVTAKDYTAYQRAIALAVARCAGTSIFKATCEALESRLAVGGRQHATKWLSKYYPKHAEHSEYLARSKALRDAIIGVELFDQTEQGLVAA